ncbi:MAG TPA: ribosomal protein S18-alanine N-acetyltransferase [Terriglobales bacterium]|nr:ribosomal protein S18-alanine N-acetyltransferase [Terriglobales bacterium]
MHIRAATPADIPALMDLEKAALTASHWSVEQYEALFSENSPKRLTLLIEDAGVVQAFVVGRATEREWEIENVAVAEPVRRRGRGTHLLQQFLGLVARQGAQAVSLEVRESNRAARALYEKCGFVEAGRRIRYYHNPDEDAVTYRLILP